MFWLYDHGADWFQRIGDTLAHPFYSASRWCYRRWRAELIKRTH